MLDTLTCQRIKPLLTELKKNGLADRERVVTMGCMPTGKVKMFNEQKGYGFIRPDDGGADIFFHVSALQEGDEITEGKAVSFETGPDPKTGKIKAISVDLT